MKKGFEMAYKSGNIEISFSKNDLILYCDWIGLQEENELKTAGEKILELLASRQCSKVLNDNTRVIGDWYHSVDWTSGNWFPRMQRAGLTHFAWICSDDVFTQLSAKRAVPDGDLVKAFNTFEEAYAWLIAQ